MLILRESCGLIDFMEWGRKQILLYFWYLEYIHILTYSIQKGTLRVIISVRSRPVVLPIRLPDMDSLLIHIVVFQRLLIQEVEEIFDSWWDHCPRAQHAAEEVIHKLLQCSLKGATNNVRQGRDTERSQKYQRHNYLQREYSYSSFYCAFSALSKIALTWKNLGL